MKNNLPHTVLRLTAICLTTILSLNSGCKESNEDEVLPPEADVNAVVRLVSHFALDGYKAEFTYGESRAVTEWLPIDVDQSKPNEGTCRLPLLSNRLIISTVRLSNPEKDHIYTVDLPGGQRIDERMRIEAQNRKKDFYCTPGKLASLLQNAKFSQEAAEISIGGQLNDADFQTLKSSYYKLETIVLMDQKTLLASAFANSSVGSVSAPSATAVGESCFDGATQLRSFSAKRVQSVGGNAFRQTALTELSFPVLTQTEAAAFCDMKQLRMCSLPDLRQLRANVFTNCTNLRTVDLSAVRAIGQGAFYGCESLETLSFPEVTTVEPMVFQECGGLRGLIMDKLTALPDQMCLYCTKLETVSARAATTIGKQAFGECGTLAAVDLPEVLYMDSYAFLKCKSLREVSLPKATRIGENGSQFAGCSALTRVSMPALEQIGQFMFSECANLSSVDLMQARTLGIHAFEGCSSLEELHLQSVVTVNGGFNSMPALKRLHLPRADEFRGDCFVGTPQLSELRLGATQRIAVGALGLVFVHVSNSANCDLYLNGNNYKDAKLSSKIWQEATWKNIYQYE